MDLSTAWTQLCDKLFTTTAINQQKRNLCPARYNLTRYGNACLGHKSVPSQESPTPRFQQYPPSMTRSVERKLYIIVNYRYINRGQETARHAIRSSTAYNLDPSSNHETAMSYASSNATSLPSLGVMSPSVEVCPSPPTSLSVPATTLLPTALSVQSLPSSEYVS